MCADGEEILATNIETDNIEFASLVACILLLSRKSKR